MEHAGRTNSDGNSIRNNEDIEKEQVGGGGLDSGTGNEISDMELEQDQMQLQLQGNADAEGVVRTSEDAERTLVLQEERGTLPQTSAKVDIPKVSSIETGKQLVLPDARARSRRHARRDQVSGSTASKATKMRAECKRVQAVTYQVRAETAEGLQALREKIKVNGGALWEADRGASDFFLAK